MTNFDDEGYDFYIAKKMSAKDWEMYSEALLENAERFEMIVIPAGLYLLRNGTLSVSDDTRRRSA